MRTMILLGALAALLIASSATARPEPRPWFAHLNGAGKLVCDRGNNGVLGPFDTRAECLDAIDEQGSDAPPVTRIAPQIDRMGACQINGQYVDLTNTQFFAGIFVDSKGVTQKVVPANYLQGIGETCDNPANLGYKFSGFYVSDGGSVYLQDKTFNVYPYYTK